MILPKVSVVPVVLSEDVKKVNDIADEVTHELRRKTRSWWLHGVRGGERVERSEEMPWGDDAFGFVVRDDPVAAFESCILNGLNSVTCEERWREVAPEFLTVSICVGLGGSLR